MKDVLIRLQEMKAGLEKLENDAVAVLADLKQQSPYAAPLRARIAAAREMCEWQIQWNSQAPAPAPAPAPAAE